MATEEQENKILIGKMTRLLQLLSWNSGERDEDIPEIDPVFLHFTPRIHNGYLQVSSRYIPDSDDNDASESLDDEVSPEDYFLHLVDALIEGGLETPEALREDGHLAMENAEHLRYHVDQGFATLSLKLSDFKGHDLEKGLDQAIAFAETINRQQAEHRYNSSSDTVAPEVGFVSQFIERTLREAGLKVGVTYMNIEGISPCFRVYPLGSEGFSPEEIEKVTQEFAKTFQPDMLSVLSDNEIVVGGSAITLAAEIRTNAPFTAQAIEKNTSIAFTRSH